MGTIASQITSLTIVYSTVYSDADQRKYQSSASLAFVWGIHRRPVNSPHKWPVTRKMFPFDDVIMHGAVDIHFSQRYRSHAEHSCRSPKWSFKSPTGTSILVAGALATAYCTLRCVHREKGKNCLADDQLKKNDPVRVALDFNKFVCPVLSCQQYADLWTEGEFRFAVLFPIRVRTWLRSRGPIHLCYWTPQMLTRHVNRVSVLLLFGIPNFWLWSWYWCS